MPETRSAEALGAIRLLMLSGEWQPGATFSEVKLAEDLGISRTPIREAVAELVSAGIVEKTPGSALRLRVMTAQDLEDAMDHRLVIERVAVEKLVRRRTRRLNQLRDVLEAAEEAIPDAPAGYLFNASEFHCMMSALACGHVSRHVLRPLIDIIYICGRGALASEEFMRRDAVEHRRILEAMESAIADPLPDPSVALGHLTRHLDHMKQTILGVGTISAAP